VTRDTLNARNMCINQTFQRTAIKKPLPKQGPWGVAPVLLRHGLDRSEGQALPHQRNTSDATDDRNRRIHDRGGNRTQRWRGRWRSSGSVHRPAAISVSAYATPMVCQPCVQLGVRRTHSSTKLQCWTGFISE